MYGYNYLLYWTSGLEYWTEMLLLFNVYVHITLDVNKWIHDLNM